MERDALRFFRAAAQPIGDESPHHKVLYQVWHVTSAAHGFSMALSISDKARP